MAALPGVIARLEIRSSSSLTNGELVARGLVTAVLTWNWFKVQFITNLRAIICQVATYGRQEPITLLREVKNKRKLQTFSSKSGHGCFREVVAYKRFQISDLSLTWKLFVFWKTGRREKVSRLPEVVATGGWTVVLPVRQETWRSQKKTNI